MNFEAVLQQALMEDAVLDQAVLDKAVLDEPVFEAAVVKAAVLETAVLENVRRYRAIASLCRQTAAFRPLQRLSLLQQAEEWERLAVIELESHCTSLETADEEPEPTELESSEPEPSEPESSEPESSVPLVDTRWWLPRREGLFAGLQA